MFWRLKSYLRRLRVAMQPMRQRGLGLVPVLLLHVPTAFLLRAWRVLAQPINGGLIQRALNQPRFASFQDRLAPGALPRFYVIVMPLTLHYLLPCLQLLQGQAQIVLLANGARAWELRLLQQRYPDLPMFRLRALPWSSVAHGHVISLLLQNQRGNFGIIDHDCYVFDRSIFTQLTPRADECVLSLFGEASHSVAFTFALTYFLYFNAEVLQPLMRRYGVDARLYRQTPAAAAECLLRIGLGPNRFWKHYHNFRDTLHVLFAVALAEGLKIRFLVSRQEVPAMHVGGTSIGTHHAKDLSALYIHLRFLELQGDPLLTRRYAFLTAPLRSPEQALALLDPDDPARETLAMVDQTLQTLRAALADPLH